MTSAGMGDSGRPAERQVPPDTCAVADCAQTVVQVVSAVVASLLLSTPMCSDHARAYRALAAPATA